MNRRIFSVESSKCPSWKMNGVTWAKMSLFEHEKSIFGDAFYTISFNFGNTNLWQFFKHWFWGRLDFLEVRLSIEDLKELIKTAETDLRKITYHCLSCDEPYKPFMFKQHYLGLHCHRCIDTIVENYKKAPQPEDTL